MAMKIRYTELGKYGAKIGVDLQNLTTALDKAKSAGESAIAAGGGAGTGVGRAIQSSIASFPVDQHGNAVKVIGELQAALEGVSKTYGQADSDLISQINAIKAKADALVAAQNGGGGATSSGASGGSASVSSNFTTAAY